MAVDQLLLMFSLMRLAMLVFLNGLPRSLANEVAISMVKGSAILAYNSKLVPAILRDQVCSPGGTTIKGVVSLEKNGFRHAVIDAVNKSNNIKYL